MSENDFYQLKSQLDTLPPQEGNRGMLVRITLLSRVVEQADTIAALTGVEAEAIYAEAITVASYQRLAIYNNLACLAVSSADGRCEKAPYPEINPVPPHTRNETEISVPLRVYRLGELALQEYGGVFERLVEDGVYLTRKMLANDMDGLVIMPNDVGLLVDMSQKLEPIRHRLPFDITIDVPVSN